MYQWRSRGKWGGLGLIKRKAVTSPQRGGIRTRTPINLRRLGGSTPTPLRCSFHLLSSFVEYVSSLELNVFYLKDLLPKITQMFCFCSSALLRLFITSNSAVFIGGTMGVGRGAKGPSGFFHMIPLK